MGGHRVWTTGRAWLYVYEWLRAHPAERDNRVWTGWGRNTAPLYCRIEARFPLKLLLPLLVRLMRRQNDKSFAVLKRLLETHAASSVQDAV